MIFKKPQRFVHTTVLHHSASSNPEHNTIEWLYNLHVNQNGWCDVGYHFFIDYDGNILSGRNLETQPAAQVRFNTGTIAICAAGIGNSFNEDQFKALKNLCLDIDKAYKGKMAYKGHRDLMATECPHYDYKSLLNLDNNGYIIKKGFWSRLFEKLTPSNLFN